jgi:hypothetical protein
MAVHRRKNCDAFVDIRRNIGDDELEADDNLRYEVYQTYEEACIARDLFDDMGEAKIVIEECVVEQDAPASVRSMIAILLAQGYLGIATIISNPAPILHIGTKSYSILDWLMSDFITRGLGKKESKNAALLDIKERLDHNGKDLADYFSDQPGLLPTENNTELQRERLRYDKDAQEKIAADTPLDT